jgi:mannose-6-phosphate isomerase-like protein (cupin superfamily)
MAEKVNLAEALARFSAHWTPHVVGRVNGVEVKLVKFQGEFVWHHHAEEDELFLVVRGGFDMRFRDRTVRLEAGEFLIVPRGVEHQPYAEREVEVLLVEPAGTLNTGNVREARTVAEPPRLA